MPNRYSVSHCCIPVQVTVSWWYEREASQLTDRFIPEGLKLKACKSGRNTETLELV
jgi:hypothetical protein